MWGGGYTRPVRYTQTGQGYPPDRTRDMTRAFPHRLTTDSCKNITGTFPIPQMRAVKTCVLLIWEFWIPGWQNGVCWNLESLCTTKLVCVSFTDVIQSPMKKQWFKIFITVLGCLITPRFCSVEFISDDHFLSAEQQVLCNKQYRGRTFIFNCFSEQIAYYVPSTAKIQIENVSTKDNFNEVHHLRNYREIP